MQINSTKHMLPKPWNSRDKETAAATLAPDRAAGLGHGSESGPMCRFKPREEGGGARCGSDHGANPMDKEATELGKKAKELKKASEALHQEERSGNKGRKWRKNMKVVEKAEATWAFTLLDYIGKLIFAIVGLLGTAASAFFCYLLIAVVAGEMMLGLKLVFIIIHPMKWGGTLMNSFLFNVGLILLCSISVIQFCETTFAYYAQATAAQEIFGHTLQSLRGIN
ncbi:hypothetical protein ACQJBY_033430 [Aegilops geniculata]